MRTGLGASVAEWLADHGCGTPLVRLGVDGYQSSGAARDLFARAGLDAEGIAASHREGASLGRALGGVSRRTTSRRASGRASARRCAGRR